MPAFTARRQSLAPTITFAIATCPRRMRRRRLRLLSGWSDVMLASLAVIGLAFLPARSVAIIPSVVAWTLLVLGIEAAARRHLVGYLLAVLCLGREPG